MVQNLLAKTGIDLSVGDGIPELIKFQEHFREYKVNVYQGPAFEYIMFEEQVESPKRIDNVERHYHGTVNIKGAMAKYVCKECNKVCRNYATHRCDQTRSDCMTRPPCAFSAVRIPCAKCNRHFRSQTCFATKSRAPRIRNPFVSARDVARPVER